MPMEETLEKRKKKKKRTIEKQSDKLIYLIDYYSWALIDDV